MIQKWLQALRGRRCDPPPTQPSGAFLLDSQIKEQLQASLQNQLKQIATCERALREAQKDAQAEKEQLILEILEVFDSLEPLIDYWSRNPDPAPPALRRLPRSLGGLRSKLLTLLEKRGVVPLEIPSDPDPHTCRVVEREVRPDLPSQTITHVVRRGFRWQERIVRPNEVITSTPE